ncbi:MAG TPA: sodium:proton antiporter [Thermomicrobiales bacterium]|nr:sodium:proton antiporter [Thermomicrobiales bacterium]
MDETTVVTIWFVIIGFLLVVMAVGRTLLRPLPLSTPLLYLIVGIVFGEAGFELLSIDPFNNAALLERVTEIAVIVSLFTAGLKLRVPLRDAAWRLPLSLASLSMVVTVGLIALTGYYGLGLTLGAAVLFGAVLAPTDPVLASDVQVTEPGDRDHLRFALTGEAGLNDGTAFPFLMLGLGLMGHHELGEKWSRWWLVDVAWAIPGGLVIGFSLGTAIGMLVLYLRRRYPSAMGGEDFLAMGLIALSYGLALLLHTYGFLAVFAAGLAMRKIEEQAVGHDRSPQEVLEEVATDDLEERAATDETLAPAVMTRSLLHFNEQLERVGEVGIMLLVGAMISTRYLPVVALWFVPLLFLVIRPIAAAIGVLGSDTTRVQRGFISWFGVRGIGSIYYLMFAVVHGLEEATARELIGLTLTVIATSVVIHGISVTPMMSWYNQHYRPEER